MIDPSEPIDCIVKDFLEVLIRILLNVCCDFEKLTVTLTLTLTFCDFIINYILNIYPILTLDKLKNEKSNKVKHDF